MRKNLLVILAVVAMLTVAVVAPAAARGKPVKVDICHVPDGNLDAAHTISVSESAVRAHVKHGDTEGPCADPVEEPTNHAPVAVITVVNNLSDFSGNYMLQADGYQSFDLDGEALTYSWSLSGPVEHNAAGPEFYASNLPSGTYTLTLTVSDGAFSGSQSLTIPMG